MIIKHQKIHPITLGRKMHGEYHTLMPLLKLDEKKFKNYLRMEITTFNYILRKVSPFLVKKWCNLHSRPIGPEERLVLTLRFLATGNTFSQMHFSFRMGVSTISGIVVEVMEIIWRVLSIVHMPIPTKEKFLEIADGFNLCGFPHCIGAIDGRLVRIKKPDGSGSLFINYKKFFSVNLQAVVDANCKYVVIDVGAFGRQSDGQTFKASKLYKALEENKLQIPGDDKLQKSQTILPYCFIADGAYPLMKNLMKPFPGTLLPHYKEVFNKRLSSSRVLVENAFGFTCQKWRIFYTTIQVSPKKVESIIKCSCLLSNIIIDLEDIDLKKKQVLATHDLDQVLHPAEKDYKNEFVYDFGEIVRREFTAYFLQHPF